jgi:hypothetical protein
MMKKRIWSMPQALMLSGHESRCTFHEIIIPSYMKTISPFMFAALLLASCAKKVTFNPSTMVPGASGAVKIKKEKNANYLIDLQVRNLPKADDLHPPKRTYTVWIETTDNRALNVGNLDNSRGLFSRKRKGELVTTSSFRPVRVFITPEDQRAPTVPGSEPVLSTNLFKSR